MNKSDADAFFEGQGSEGACGLCAQARLTVDVDGLLSEHVLNLGVQVLQRVSIWGTGHAHERRVYLATGS